jgi:hypothetical protein
MLHHLTGAACFSIDPYQIGLNNDEAIESGAFWFYRKLRFRPTRAALMKVAQAEEKKIAAGRGHRTPTRILRRLAEAPMVYEMGHPGAKAGDWDNFKIRNLGLAVQKRAAVEFGGDLERLRAASIRRVANKLAMSASNLGHGEHLALENLALVMDLIPALAKWNNAEKRKAAAIIRAKWGSDDAAYAQLLRSHPRLREAIIKIGSDSDQ